MFRTAVFLKPSFCSACTFNSFEEIGFADRTIYSPARQISESGLVIIKSTETNRVIKMTKTIQIKCLKEKHDGDQKM